ILRERSPFATAVVTPAMLRTWLVRFDAMELTDSVKSRQVPATPFTSACPPSLPSVPTSRHARHFRGERVELVHHRVDRVLQLQNFPARIDRDLGRKIALGHGCGHTCDVTHLVGQ